MSVEGIKVEEDFSGRMFQLEKILKKKATPPLMMRAAAPSSLHDGGVRSKRFSSPGAEAQGMWDRRMDRFSCHL